MTTALVTGASSGMGKATAKQLLADGYTVYAAARRLEKMADLERLGARTLKMDITKEEDVQAVGVSILSGAHLPLLEALAGSLREAGLEDRLWLVGGVIPKQDREAVVSLGFEGVFPTGSSLDDIARFIEEGVA